MSDTQTKRRIRAQNSASDPHIMGFVLDAIVQAGPPVRFDSADAAAPLSQALFAVAGVRHVEVSAAAIWVRKHDAADWSVLKPAVAAAIRTALDSTDNPLGTPKNTDPDAALLQAVEELLDRQVNPSVAAHGGHIGAERVVDGAVYLRMSGGCQGCAASAATLRDGVERMLRAALPQIREIVDVTDHAEGETPFYARGDGQAPAFNRPVPPNVIHWEGEEIAIDPDYLAPRLGLSVEALLDGMRSGDVASVTETGTGIEAGTSRIIFRSASRAWAAEVFTDGTAREIPPPRVISVAAGKDDGLAARVRAHLEALPPAEPFITYGALARALGYWAPGSVARITRVLEDTMREDVAAGRPFIAARAVSRGSEKQSARGFFDLARQLGCGPEADETDREFHAREIARLGHSQSGIR
jgi:Fe-S cluster biogenesis protein NfuA